MFGFIFRRAQATVDNAINQVVYGSVVIVPLLVAAGFGTAALAVRLNRDYPPEITCLIIAGIYAAIAVLAAGVNALRTMRESPAADSPAAEAASAQQAEDDGLLSGGDREMLLAALSSAAPLALPAVIRTALRNLPIILAVLITAFVLSRPDSAAESQPEPAE